MSIRAVVFDFGGVLIRTEDPRPRAEFAARWGVTPEELVYLVLEGPKGTEAQLGYLHPRELWFYVAAELGIPNPDPEAMERAFWGGDRFDMTMVDLVKRLRTRYQVGLLSNAWITLRDWIEHHTPLAGLFHRMVISAEVHLMKPDPRIYARMLGELGVMPHEAVFIDDRPENVEGAKRVGMHAFQFTSPPEVFRNLEALGVDIPGETSGT